MRVSRGFTLIELMFTVALLGIVMAIAMPAVNQLMQGSRARTHSQDLIRGLSLARSEAIKRRALVGLAASSTNWANGWVLWVDTDGDNVVDDDEAILRNFPAFTDEGLTLTGTSTTVRYNSEGLPEDVAAGAVITFNFGVSSGDCNLSRVVEVRHMGRAEISQGCTE